MRAQSLSRVGLFATLWTVSTRPLCPWNFPGNNTRVGSHFLLQGIFPTQGSNSGEIEPRSPELQADSLPFEPPGKPQPSER